MRCKEAPRRDQNAFCRKHAGFPRPPKNCDGCGVGAGEKTFIAGFVVAGTESKKIIIRAIGPSLADHGIDLPVMHPTVAIFDKHGQPYENGYAYPACVGCPTYEGDLAESLVKAGAFPLAPGSNDVVKMMPFAPGAYTVHVNSADGTPGVVLLEIYEVP